MILTLSILWPFSIALTGMLCHYHGRKHRDSEWRWAMLFRPQETEFFCHHLKPKLPEKP